MLILAQALMGLAQAAVFPCAVQSVSVWVPKTRRASFCAALTIGMQIGAIITAFLTGLLIKQWDWRIVFLAYSAPGILWAVGFFLRFHNHPSEDASVNSAERRLIDERPDEDSSSASNRDPNSEPLAWFQILTNRSILCLCGQQMFRAAGYSFFAAWFPSFLQETRHVKIEKSAFLQGTIFTATLFGGLLGGMLVDRIYHRTGNLRWSRSGVGGSCMLICGLLIFCAYFAESADAAVLLLALAAFTAALAGPCAYVTTIDLGKEHVSSVFGLMNMMGNLAAAATPVAIGYLFGYTKDWNIVLALFALAYVLAAVCWALVDPGQTLSPSEILQDEDL